MKRLESVLKDTEKQAKEGAWDLMNTPTREKKTDEGVRSDIQHHIEKQIEQHGFIEVLKGFMYALDNKDPEQKKTLDALIKLHY